MHFLQFVIIILAGLVLLRTKLASWRYQKTSRPINIMLNVKADSTENTETFTDLKKTISNDNEDQEIPLAIEDIIEQLIQGLRDKAITIRYVYNICFFFNTSTYMYIKSTALDYDVYFTLTIISYFLALLILDYSEKYI